MEDPVTADKKRKGTAASQADAIEAESPAEDKAEGGKEEPGDTSVKNLGKAANQGAGTTGAPITRNEKGGSTLATKTAAAPLPASSRADLAAASRAQKAAPKPAPKSMDEMTDDEVDAAAAGDSLGLKAAAIAYRKQHPRKTAAAKP